MHATPRHDVTFNNAQEIDVGWLSRGHASPNAGLSLGILLCLHLQKIDVTLSLPIEIYLSAFEARYSQTRQEICFVGHWIDRYIAS